MSNKSFTSLKNPPITEAIFEVLFDIGDDFDIKCFDEFYLTLSNEFVTKEEISSFEGQFNLKTGGSKDFNVRTIGYLFLNNDKSKAIQVRKNGFLYSIAKNSYKNWEPFRDEAWKIFIEFVTKFNVNFIHRISLRFINSIMLPTNLIDIKDFILTAPSLPSNMAFGLNKMFNQLTFTNKEINSTGIITQALDIGVNIEDSFEYILDIDVQYVVDDVFNENKISNELENLRHFKNQLFFNSITNKTLKSLNK